MRVLILTVLLVLSGCKVVTDPGVGASTSASAGPATQQLAELAVGTWASMAGYSRDRFPVWADQGGGCNTRDVVLKRDGTGVTANEHCTIKGGHWVSPYDNKPTADPQSLDIDHMVPLANAWRTGASGWTDQVRTQFANDLTRPQLLAVTATINRSKGDQDPSQWKPPNRGYWCQYATRWIAVKHYWKLIVTVTEKAALTDMLGTCA
jgi:hypothetical protein